MKKITKILVFTFIVIMFCNTKTIIYAFSGYGSGIISDPYLVSNVAQLKEINNDLNAHYKLTSDINLSNSLFQGLATTQIKAFKGSLDGAGYNIQNLGEVLFHYTNGATIKNVKIENVYIRRLNQTGALIGTMNGGIVENCSVVGEGKIIGANDVGGLIGYKKSGDIRKSYSEIDIEIYSIASAYDELEEYAYMWLEVDPGLFRPTERDVPKNIGGLVGYDQGGTIEQSYVKCNIDSVAKIGDNVGGIVGNSSFTNIRECFYSGKIDIHGQFVGGILGIGNNVIIDNCFTLGSISAGEAVETETARIRFGKIGTIAGSIGNGNVIENCYSAIRLLGRNEGIYSGLDSRVYNAYIAQYSSVINSYYDFSMSNCIYDGDGNGKTYENMTNITTFKNWDFNNIWSIENGKSYPYLKNLPNPVPTILKSPQNLQIKESSYNSYSKFRLGITWDKVLFARNYSIIYGDNIITDIEQNVYSIDNLASNTEYTIKVRANYYNGSSEWSLPVIGTTKMLPLTKVTGVKVLSIEDTKTKITWDKQAGAQEYDILLNGNLVETTVENSIEINKLLPNTRYNVQIKAKNSYEVATLSDKCYMLTRLPKATALKVTNKTDSTADISWEKVDGAESYVIYSSYSTLTVTEPFVSFKNLPSDYSFTVKILSKSKDNYGDYSDILKVTTNLSKVTGVTIIDSTDSTISLSWNPLEKAISYEVNYGTNQILETNTNSITIKNLNNNNLYNIKIRAKASENYGDWSDIFEANTVSTCLFDLNINNGLEYNLLINASNITEFNSKIFNITYDPSKVTLVDFAAQTKALDTTVGKIKDTNITIISNNNGVITFSVDHSVSAGKSWTGVLTILEFKANETGNTTVKLE